MEGWKYWMDKKVFLILKNKRTYTGKVIDDKKDDLGDIVSETIEKGKEFIDDIRSKDEEVTEEEQIEETPKKNEKSARDRLKDKGFLK